ncbi:hypothetical protein [Phenylobacterium sp.]|uniref:hypothetical protein n=1 Tax=Phenylobacterium sp. TaxID=1871053 RepID=UPI00263822E0|nr:hypothetical protein [Phenylobacterium sp.]
MGALFPVECPHCGASTAVAPEVFHRWWPGEGRSERAASLPGKVLPDQPVRAVFSAMCPSCDDPLALILTAKGGLLSALVSRPGVPSARSLESIEPNEISKVEVYPPVRPSKPPLVLLPPKLPENFGETLKRLAEDAARPERGGTAAAGCRWLLDEVLSDLGHPPGTAAKPSGGLLARWFGPPPRQEPGLRSRLRKACEAGKLPRWALTRAEGLDLEAKTPPDSAKAYVDYLAAVLRAAYPGL